MNISTSHENRLMLKDRQIFILEVLLILAFSIFPLFRNFHANGTTYLSWEGAYRLYLGQVPYKDFGMPLGFGYWIIPAIFFKIFGPFLYTLIKAQVFINIIGAFAFRSILKSFQVSPPVRMLGILVFLVSYTFINFWPWYNHSVIVFELIGFAFLMNYLANSGRRFGLAYLFLGAFFLFLTFFTKQDSGGIAFVLALTLLICHRIYGRKMGPLLWFLGFYMATALLFILPFVPYGFGYWFDYGQPPHSARISIFDLVDLFLSESVWLKFYLLVIVLLLLRETGRLSRFLSDKNKVMFTLFTLGILFQASVIQVTSYVPKNGNIFFHSFAIVFIMSLTDLDEKVNFRRPVIAAMAGAVILLWWSAEPWNYVRGAIVSRYPELVRTDAGEVSIRTYAMGDSQEEKAGRPAKWVTGPWKEFERINMLEESVKGIDRVMHMDVVKEKGKEMQFLNMSELTPVESMLGVVPEAGQNIPLWYHKNVGIFDREINMYKSRIEKNFYDLVLYEYFPTRNNFYPFEIRDYLQQYYDQVDSIPSPRNVQGTIEVYVKKKPNDEENR